MEAALVFAVVTFLLDLPAWVLRGKKPRVWV